MSVTPLKSTPGRMPKLTYPNPWFDLSSSYVPKDIKTMFKYCRTFFYKNGFLNSVITKLAEYPITDLLFDKSMKPEDRDLYEELFSHDYKMNSFLVQIGLDYMTYGNSFISSNMKFTRFLECPECGSIHKYEDIKFAWRDFRFTGQCPTKECGKSVIFKIKDEYLKKPEFLKFIRWAPENIDLEYDDLTGTTTYYYKIKESTTKQIIAGNKRILKTTPKLFIDALREKKRVELDPSNIYHFKRPSLAEDSMGWGKPLILSALAEIWYLQTLKKGNEAIASEHIVPFRALYPASQNQDPFSTMNMGTWRGKIQSSVEQWKKDPNHIAIFPIPIGYQNLGGDAKLLMVSNEIKYLEETIINSLGVPLEFIRGGASWSGSSISLRIIENHFLNYRELLEDFVNYFVIKKIMDHLSLPKAKITFKKLRMADDSETKRLALDLHEKGKLSASKLLEDFGYDYEEEKANIKNDAEFENNVARDIARRNAESEVENMIITAKGQVRAQKAQLEETAKMREEQFKQEISEENKDIKDSEASEILEKYTEELMLLDEVEREKALMALNKKMPYTTKFIIKRIQEKMMVDPVSQGLAAQAEEEEQAGDASKPKPKKDEGVKKSEGHPKKGV